MDEKWFCRIGDREFGPLLIAQLQRLATRGQLAADSPVRRDNARVWKTAAEVPALSNYLVGSSASLPTAKRLAPAGQPEATKITTSTASSQPQAPPPSAPAVSIVTGDAGSVAAKVGTHPPAATESGGLSRGTIGLLAGLGAVVVVLLVTLIVVLNQGGDDVPVAKSDDTPPAADDNSDSGTKIPAVTNTSSAEKPVDKRKFKPPPVHSWSSRRSTKQIKSSVDGSPLCRIRISAVWASADPSDPARTIPVPTSGKPAGGTQAKKDEVLDLEALKISKKKRVDATGKIISPGPDETEAEKQPAPATTPQPAVDPAEAKFVFIEVKVSNVTADRTLNYLGWNGDGETTAGKDAKLYRHDFEPCLFVSRLEAPRNDRMDATEIAPGQSIVDVLVFELPEAGFESLKLVLPTTALELTGDLLGYQFKPQDVAGVALTQQNTSTAPPKVEKPRGPAKGAIEQGIRNEQEGAKTSDPPKPATDPKPVPKDDPDAEFKKLQDSIEKSRE